MRGPLRLAVAMGVVSACVTPTVARDCPPCLEPAARDEATSVRAALVAFVEAADARDFVKAYAWLSAGWRDRYTPQRLEEDFHREPRAAGLVSRLKASLQAPVRVEGDRAVLLVGAGRAVRLTREERGWRIVSLDSPAG